MDASILQYITITRKSSVRGHWQYSYDPEMIERKEMSQKGNRITIERKKGWFVIENII